MNNTSRAQTSFFWISRAFLIFALPLFISDLPGYLMATSNFLLAHQLPYRDFPVEYPPLAYFLLVAARKITLLLDSNSETALRASLSIFILPFDFALFRSFRDYPPCRRAAAIYLFLSCMLAPLLFDRLDLIVAACIVFPFLRGQKSRFAFWWGLGGALKLAPALLLPLAAGRAKGTRTLLLGWAPALLSLV
jgi:hypothetical protein